MGPTDLMTPTASLLRIFPFKAILDVFDVLPFYPLELRLIAVRLPMELELQSDRNDVLDLLDDFLRSVDVLYLHLYQKGACLTLRVTAQFG
jgi:hypothetical protein